MAGVMISMPALAAVKIFISCPNLDTGQFNKRIKLMIASFTMFWYMYKLCFCGTVFLSQKVINLEQIDKDRNVYCRLWSLSWITINFEWRASFSNGVASPVFYQNEEIFVQLDDLDELDRIIHAWIGFDYHFTQAQKTF